MEILRFYFLSNLPEKKRIGLVTHGICVFILRRDVE